MEEDEDEEEEEENVPAVWSRPCRRASAVDTLK